MRRLLLVGMMGAGKTTVGRLLAAELGWPYADSDEAVEAATGRSVAELFEEGGEPSFRAAESAALSQALAGDGPGVVSVAGGAVLDPANRAEVQLMTKRARQAVEENYLARHYFRRLWDTATQEAARRPRPGHGGPGPAAGQI